MTTFNFNPEILAQIKARVQIDFAAHQPIGGHGFRTGKWGVTVDGQPRKVYASVPHACDLDTQYDMVRAAAAREVYRAEGHELTA